MAKKDKKVVEDKKSDVVQVKLDHITMQIIMRQFLDFYRATLTNELTKTILENYIDGVVVPAIEKEKKEEA